MDFIYGDADSFENEISELYSYGEESEFFSNRNAFEESMEDCGLPLTWRHMVLEQKSRAINFLMTTLEVSCRTTRMKSCRALAYLIQGSFGECSTIEEQVLNSQENVFLLCEHGIFHTFVQQFLIEADLNSNQAKTHSDSSELRLILSVLYTVTETMYRAESSTDTKRQEMRQQFIQDLQCPIGDELLSVTLFQMLNNFCGGLAPHYPVRKITLLLWKIILITLGGSQALKATKEANRAMYKLPPPIDDTLEVTKNMRPCSPPVMSDGQARARTALPGSFMNKRKVLKQPAFDDAVFAYATECLMNSLIEQTPNTMEQENNEDREDEFNYNTEDPNPGDESSDLFLNSIKQDGISLTDGAISQGSRNPRLAFEEPGEITSESSSDSGITTDEKPSLSSEENEFETGTESRALEAVSTPYKGLPWSPKVRKHDLNEHLTNIRQKFLGYTLPNDLETTFGLPNPIIEGVEVLKKHLYTSLSEVQLEREELIEKYPYTHKEMNSNYRECPTEKLYSCLLPRLPQYMIALLKILLAASTDKSKNKTERTESINILYELSLDIDDKQTPTMIEDANRHIEIIIKAVSGILILLLKHFKTNHIYQFEYVSQQLMFANCIPLILKFLSQDIYNYIEISTKKGADFFPVRVLAEAPEVEYRVYSWRNTFSCINLVRVLNKLTKWKHSRIMMLVVFKSAPTLAKALSVQNALFQLYVLKLLKVQLKFLGRLWKKSNMKLMSAIYQKVRHRLTDDWAYSNDNEARPWDFQSEEFTLQSNINKFHQRRYHELLAPNGKVRKRSVFGEPEKLGALLEDSYVDEDYEFGFEEVSPFFKRNYEKWLESEVFQRTIDWDKLLRE